jgi:imidazolonepropionase-like amidohydrolase
MINRLTTVLYYVIYSILLIHFIFIFFLSETKTILPIILLFIGIGLYFPFAKQYLKQIPFLRNKLFSKLIITLFLLSANIFLEKGNKIDIEQGNYAFINATIITGHRDSTPISNGVLLVDGDGFINSVGTSAEVPVPNGYKIIDLNGQYIMPGLINAHGHLMLIGRDPEADAEMPAILTLPSWTEALLENFINSYIGERIILRVMEKSTMRALKGGVTTIRGLGDPAFYDVKMRKKIQSGKVLGPRLLVAGEIISITGGHGSQLGYEIDGPIEARKAVRYLLDHEVDVIKIASTGGIADSKRLGEAGELQMTLDEIQAITNEAHRKGIMVVAHAESTTGVHEALLAGVDNIEHGAILNDESIELFKNNPNSLRGYTDYHPTLSVFEGDIILSEKMEQIPRLRVMRHNAKVLREEVINGYKKALQHGVRISVGTDAGLVDHASVWRELSYFKKYGGISNAEAIHLGTLATAESIGIMDITGSLDKGKYADFVVLESDPHQDLETLGNPSMVVVSGIIVPK